MNKIHTNETKERNAAEWRLVALAIDRMFFILYLATICLSTITTFFMCFFYYNGHEAIGAGKYYIHGLNESEYMQGIGN